MATRMKHIYFQFSFIFILLRWKLRLVAFFFFHSWSIWPFNLHAICKENVYSNVKASCLFGENWLRLAKLWKFKRSMWKLFCQGLGSWKFPLVPFFNEALLLALPSSILHVANPLMFFCFIFGKVVVQSTFSNFYEVLVNVHCAEILV